MGLRSWLNRVLGRKSEVKSSGARPKRGPATHVIVMDGTRSSMVPQCRTNAAITYKLLEELGPQAGLTLHYEPGIQWTDWRSTWGVMTGRGINERIARAYGGLASRYRPGDKIVLIGYSRGAYAVRSLAGVIDRVGLVRQDCATERMVTQAYRHYREGPDRAAARAFRAAYCHPSVEIEAVAVWDTVRALGFRVPLLYWLMPERQPFHSHVLGPAVKNGLHALALNETRVAYAPVLWHCPPDWKGHVEQVWFRGVHGDVGGQLGGFDAARPLSNIPLVWMLNRLEACGVPLPEGWVTRFECDPEAPSKGPWRGSGRYFIVRRKRRVGDDRSEHIHDSVPRELWPSEMLSK